MRKIIILFIISMFVFSIMGCSCEPFSNLPAGSIKSYRDIPGVTEDEIRQIKALKAGRGGFSYGAVLSSESFVLEDGSYAGFASKLCALLSGLFEAEFNIELYERDELARLLGSGALDFTGELASAEENGAVYMTPPIAERLLRVFSMADRHTILTEADITGLNIGFLKGDATADLIKRYYNIEFSCTYVDNYQIAASMIKIGEIDAFIGEAVSDPAFEEYGFISSRTLFPLIYKPVSLATANPDLAPIISVFSKYIKTGGIGKLEDLYKEGDFDYSKYKFQKSLTDEEKAYIENMRQNGEPVYVAYEHDNYPVDFYDESEDCFAGIAVDVLNEIGRLIGLRFEPAVTEDTAWAEIYDKLLSGEIQMAAQLLYSDARAEHFIWSSTPYALSWYAIISKTDFPNLEAYQISRYTVGVTKKTAYEDLYRELFSFNDNLVWFDTTFECLDALESGEIDLLMGSEYILLAQTNYREKSKFKINFKFDVPLESYFGFNKDEELLCSIIDKAQQYVDTDIIDVNWTGRAFDHVKKMAEARTLYLTIFSAILVFLLVLFVFEIRKNEKLSIKLEEIASNDSLTGILNRRFFLEQADVQTARSLRLGHNSFIVIFDLDFFKSVNDTYGHQAGDEVLIETSRRVKKTIRPSDLFGRYGGEEFILIMSDMDRESALNAAERIRESICVKPVEFEDIQIQITASFGIAYAAPVNDVNTAIKYADAALYQAKNEGRNRTVFYEETV